MPVDATTPPTSFSDAASREALRKMSDPAETERSQEEERERCAKLIRLELAEWEGQHGGAPTDVVAALNEAERSVRFRGLPEGHEKALEWLSGVQAGRVVAAERELENVRREGRSALAEAGMRAAAAETLLRRIAKYAREDRARTPGVTRLARALDEVDQILASPPPPSHEAAVLVSFGDAAITSAGEGAPPPKVMLYDHGATPPAPESGDVTIPMELARVTSAHRHAALVAEEERAAREDTLVDWRRVSAEARRLACVIAPPAAGVVDLMRVRGLPESTPVNTSGTAPPAAGEARGTGCDDCCGSGVAIDVVLGGRVERPCPYCTKRSCT